MDIAVIGTGFIGSTLGGALERAGHRVTYGSRRPQTGAGVATVSDALTMKDVVILALPGAAVADLVKSDGERLAGKLVIDATNQMGAPVANARAALPTTIRYARAFNTLGGENMADPIFEGGPADMFFSGPAADRGVVEDVIAAVGLRPIYLGDNEEALVDSLFQLWVTLAIKQGRGRRLALRLLER
jgi:predicted dinucleotide-binding enzyme